MTIIICAICQNVFETKRPNAKTCSEACRRIWKSDCQRQDRADHHDPVMAECITCSNQFRKFGSSKVCSISCRDAWRKQWNKARHRERWSDPEYRRYHSEYQKKKMSDPTARAQQKERQRKWKLGPSIRERLLEQERERKLDPAYLVRITERAREWSRKRAAIVAAVKELGLINIGDLK